MKDIKVSDLRRMSGKEGLILQGCGGDPQEWIDGINDMLTDEGILLEGTKFQNVSRFQHDGLTDLLFPFDDVKVDIGKLAYWRLETHNLFGGRRACAPNSRSQNYEPDTLLPRIHFCQRSGLIFQTTSNRGSAVLVCIQSGTQWSEQRESAPAARRTDGSENIDDGEGEVMTI